MCRFESCKRQLYDSDRPDFDAIVERMKNHADWHVQLLCKLAGHANESKFGKNKILIDGKTRIQMHYYFIYFVPNN